MLCCIHFFHSHSHKQKGGKRVVNTQEAKDIRIFFVKWSTIEAK